MSLSFFSIIRILNPSKIQLLEAPFEVFRQQAVLQVAGETAKAKNDTWDFILLKSTIPGIIFAAFAGGPVTCIALLAENRNGRREELIFDGKDG